MIFSGSVRKAKTVAGGAVMWVSRRTTSGSVMGKLLGIFDGAHGIHPSLKHIVARSWTCPKTGSRPAGDNAAPRPHDRDMQLPSTLAWLVDAAGALPGADRLLAELGARHVVDGVPLAGGALTLAVPHPIIAHRTWLWRADTGAVIEALGFAASGI